MPDSTPSPVFTPTGQGTTWSVVGDQVTCKVSGDQTGGAYAVMEEASPPQGGTPLHRHHLTDEIVYILKGEYEVICAGERFRAPRGTTFVVPKGVPHSLRNIASETSRALVTIIPAGFENFFAAVDGVTDPDKLAEIAKNHDVELLP